MHTVTEDDKSLYQSFCKNNVPPTRGIVSFLNAMKPPVEEI